MQLKRTLYVHWPVVMMVGTIALACMLDPTDTHAVLAFRFGAGRWLEMLLSPYLIACVLVAAIGLRHAHRVWSGAPAGQFSDTDKMVTVWFLMNACWYHTGCDVASGLFQVMPNLRDAYAVSNGAHNFPMHHPARAFLDAVYWFELFVQLPLCVLTYFLYLRRSPLRPVVESFLCGLHLTGTVAYYLPNVLMGETTNPVLSNIDRTIASVWIVVPAWLAFRAAQQVRDAFAARTAGDATQSPTAVAQLARS